MADKTYTITFSERDGVLEFKVSGDLKKQDGASVQKEILGIIIQKKANFILLDQRKLNYSKDIVDGYTRIRDLPFDHPRYPTAVVDRNENQEFQKFQETVANNSGYIYKHFINIDDARRWLRELKEKLSK